MKKNIKKELFFIFVVAAYLLQGAIDELTINRPYLYVAGTIISTVLLFLIKNKYISLASSLAVVLALEFYDSHYKFFMLIPILLIFNHKNILIDIKQSEAQKKAQKNASSFWSRQICLFLSAALVIYSFVLLFEKPNVYFPQYVYRSMFIFIALLVIFIYSVTDSRNDKNLKKAMKGNLANLRYLYFTGLIGFLATAFYCLVADWAAVFSKYIAFLPWFIYLCTLFYNNDPYIKSLSDKLENILGKCDANVN